MSSQESSYTHEDAIFDAMNNQDTYVNTVYTSALGLNIVRVTGSLSAVSSALIIFVILHSSTKLTTIYHRIIALMSIGDIVGSLAMALTTLPMPKDMIYTQFEGLTAGNTRTCELQGFLFTVGTSFTVCYNTILCIYYVCSIRFHMTEEAFKKWSEPGLHCLAFLAVTATGTLQLATGFLNPSPYCSWCTSDMYPYYCVAGYVALDQDCLFIRGGVIARNVSVRYAIFYMTFIGSAVGLLAVVYSMIAIACSSYGQKRVLKQIDNELDKSVCVKVSDLGTERIQESVDFPQGTPVTSEVASAYRVHHDSTEVVVIQGMAYVLAFLICQTNVFISMFMRRETDSSAIVHLITRPLQGFFNMIIFFGHKVHNLKCSEDISTSKAIRKILQNGFDTPLHVSNILLVTNDENALYFIDAIDEGNKGDGNCERTPVDGMAENVMVESNVSSGMGSDIISEQEASNDWSGSQSDFYELKVSDGESHDNELNKYSNWNTSPSIGVLSSTGLSDATRKRSGADKFDDDPDLSSC